MQRKSKARGETEQQEEEEEEREKRARPSPGAVMKGRGISSEMTFLLPGKDTDMAGL